MVAEYSISPLSEDNAREIINWRYDQPYDLYDLEARHLEGFLNPDYRYHQVLEKNGSLVGYCCFGIDAQVPGGNYNLSEPMVLDIGVGMHPDLVGQGLGRDFVSAILDFAKYRYNPGSFRVTIADFNQRSQNTFLSHGFREGYKFIREMIEIPFTQYLKEIK